MSFNRRSNERIARVVRAVEGQTSPGWRPRFDGTPAIPMELRRFELAGPLLPFGSALAYPVRAVGANYVADTRRTERVRDSLGVVRGRGKTSEVAGTACWAIKIHDGPWWEILAFQPMVAILGALVNQAAGVKPENATFPVDGAVAMQPVGGVLDAFPTEARNPFGLTLADDEKVLLFWNETNPGWDAIAPGAGALEVRGYEFAAKPIHVLQFEDHVFTVEEGDDGAHHAQVSFLPGDEGDMLYHDGERWSKLAAPEADSYLMFLPGDGGLQWVPAEEFDCPNNGA